MTEDTARDRHRSESQLTGIVARRLGPVGPEVTCEECFELLDAYVELQIAGERDSMPAMRAHLEGCPACREDYESLLALVRGTPAGPSG